MISLPIDKYIDPILEALRSSSQVILTATPGAGKTTRLPAHLLSAVSGKIAILQPRRMAAIAASQFVAEENEWRLGDQVGYQVRQESKFNNNTRLLFMTDAILLRRLINDPELKEFELIVIDEFHERNLNQDIVLGILKELQLMGRDIKILVMSATLDLKELNHFLSESVVIDVPGVVYPLDIQYSSQALSLQTDYNFINRVFSAIQSMELNKSVDDILVFLPGVGEIQRLRELLLERNIQREIFVLHGSLNLKDQKVVLQKHSVKRVILSTNIAEASVTVSGVNAVIDSGLARVMTTNLNSGFSILNLSSISKFNAKQRSGRAAREKSGICLRLWTVHEDASREEQQTPEIKRLDLSSTVLLLSHLGVVEPKHFSWFTRPHDFLLKSACDYLKNIGAISEQGILTSLGSALLTYPVEPRFGYLLYLIEQELKINQYQDFESAYIAIALLQEKDIVRGDSKLTSTSTESDLVDRLQIFEDFRSGALGQVQVNRNIVKNIIEVAQQLKAIVNTNLKSSIDVVVSDLSRKTSSSINIDNIVLQLSLESNLNLEKEDKKLFKFLLLTQADRLCRRRLNSDRALMVGGRGVRLNSKSSVYKSEFFVSLTGVDIAGQSETLINLAHGFSKSEVLEVLKDQIYTLETPFYDVEKEQYYLKKVRRFKDLDLDEPTLTKISVTDLGDKFIDMLILRWPEVVKAHQGLNDWLSRWTYFGNQMLELKTENLNDLNLSSEINELAINNDQIRSVLEMASAGQNRWDEIVKQDLVYFIETQIDANILKKFNAQLPKDFFAPSGGVHKIIYSDIESPYVEVRLQEVFGLVETPVLGPQKKPLVFKLLAPNFRPVQVTSDIAGFWQRSYLEVKKELKGRYPKHSWPDDPLTAVPVQKGRKRW